MIVVGLLIAGIILFSMFFQSEAARVKKQFEFIADKIGKVPGENHITAAAKVARVKEVITEPFRIHAPAYAFSREIAINELATFILSKRSQYSKISVKFYDFEIAFPEKNFAQVNLTKSMQSQLKSGEFIEDFNELKCQMQKIGGTWRLKEIEVVEVLRK
jgi:hypothetical protein